MTYRTRRLKAWLARGCGYERFLRWRREKEKLMADQVWSGEQLIDLEQTKAKLEKWIGLGVPFTAGKIGANEQSLLHWALKVPIPTPLLGRRFVHFSALSYSETNAGLKPRNRESYRSYAALLKQAVASSDLLAVWRLLGEKDLIKACQASPIYTGLFSLGPFFTHLPWTALLEGKRVFIVSPFLNTIKSQLHKREQIWPGRALLPPMQVEGYSFPYLVSASTSVSWQEVYTDVVKVMSKTNFEVALFGCGALGLPLAATAKQLGRQGIHLGGLLQLIFGIRGGQFDLDPAYAALITPAWVRPSGDEIPPEAAQIENGMYW
jgi:hypothetical protein